MNKLRMMNERTNEWVTEPINRYRKPTNLEAEGWMQLPAGQPYVETVRFSMLWTTYITGKYQWMKDRKWYWIISELQASGF